MEPYLAPRNLTKRHYHGESAEVKCELMNPREEVFNGPEEWLCGWNLTPEQSKAAREIIEDLWRRYPVPKVSRHRYYTRWGWWYDFRAWLWVWWRDLPWTLRRFFRL